MNLTETAGNTLAGAINGTNATFHTTYPMQLDFVSVYINGRLKVAALADGYAVFDSFTVVLKEAPLVGDTVQVEYRTGSGFGGGADGGIPSAPLAHNLAPKLAVANKSGVCAPVAPATSSLSPTFAVFTGSAAAPGTPTTQALAPQLAAQGNNGCTPATPATRVLAPQLAVDGKNGC